MTNRIIFLISFALVSCSLLSPVEIQPPAAPPATPSDALKKKVLIVPFLNHSSLPGDELPKQAVSDVQAALGRFADLVLVSPSMIEDSENFTADDSEYNYRLLFTKARAYGISAVVTGAVEDVEVETKGDSAGLFRTQSFTATATVKFSLYDATSEREIFSKITTDQAVEEESFFFFWSRSREGQDKERGKQAVSKALARILAQLPDYVRRIAWSGHIAKTSLHRYYINAGEATGISRGQLLKVFEESQPIQDPQSGLFLGLAPGRFKGILKVVDQFGSDGAIAVAQSGGGFRENDRVEIYAPPQSR